MLRISSKAVNTGFNPFISSASFSATNLKNQMSKVRMEQVGLLTNQPRRYFSYPDHLKMEMPNLSPTMEKGNIGEWNVKVGDAIAPGDVLCSIETDKATIDFEMQDEGFVAKLMYEAGAKDIPLGKVLAILVDDKDDIAAFADYKDESVAAAPTPAAAPAAAPTSAAPTQAAAPSRAPA